MNGASRLDSWQMCHSLCLGFLPNTVQKQPLVRRARRVQCSVSYDFSDDIGGVYTGKRPPRKLGREIMRASEAVFSVGSGGIQSPEARRTSVRIWRGFRPFRNCRSEIADRKFAFVSQTRWQITYESAAVFPVGSGTNQVLSNKAVVGSNRFRNRSAFGLAYLHDAALPGAEVAKH